MRLAKLELLAYGHFRGLSLDLEAPGLHVVFGRNEAGKSTTLRAITGLLYGIDRNTRDAHVHKPADLRIGGVLVGEDGARVHVVRRKGNANTLLDARGEPMAEDVLTRLLRGISEETFRHAFGLDHDALRRGAEALLAGRGDLGESLFDASVGGGGEVQRLLERLEKEADGLYRPRGQALPVNEAIKAFAEAQKTIKERQSLPEAFLTQEKHLDTLRADLAAKLAAKKDLGARRARLDVVRKRAPLERKREALVAARAELGAIAAHAPRLAPLTQALGAYEVNVRRQRELAAESDLTRDRLAEASRRAGLSESDEEAFAERTDVKVEGRVRRLLGERDQAAVRLRTLGDDLDRARRDLARAREVPLARAEDDGGRLSRALTSAQALGDAEARLTTEAAKLAKKRRDLEARAAQAGLSGVPLEELASRAFPAPEQVETIAQRAAERDRAVQRAADKVSELDGQASGLEQQIAALAGDFAPPDAAEVRAARATRDEAWARLRAENAAGGDARARALLEAEVERAMRQTDELADRMIREADRVTTLARLRSALATAREQLATRRGELEAARTERAAVDGELGEAFARSGVVPTSLGEARTLVTRAAPLAEQVHEVESAVVETEALAAKIAGVRAELVAALGHAPAAVETHALATLVTEAAARLEAVVAERQTAQEASRDAARLAETVAEKDAAIGAAREELEAARARFSEVAAAFGLDTDASAEEVTRAFDALRELLAARTKHAETVAKAALAAAEARAFEEDVARLAAELAPDLATLPAREAAAELVARAARSEEVARDLEATTQRLAEIGEAVLAEDERALAGDDTALARVLEEVDAELAETESVATRLQKDVIGVELGLSQMRGDSLAADAAASAQEALARVRTQVERWARAKVAATILAREIERFREENQGPLLTRASALFARLTLGAYQGIKAGFDDKDKPCLLCVREGAEVRVEGLSEGTRDQLYLSLRLSSLERHAELAAPMPLVLDDVLVQLDDERARAALVVLAELAARTQVLFFTHHARLVELARGAIAPEALHVHELASRPGIVAEGAVVG